MPLDHWRAIETNNIWKPFLQHTRSPWSVIANCYFIQLSKQFNRASIDANNTASSKIQCRSINDIDPLDVLGVLGGTCDLAPVVHVDQDGRGWGHYDTLLVCLGCLPWLVPCQLDLSLLYRGLCGLDCLGCWHDPNWSLLWFLLYLLYEVSLCVLSEVAGRGCVRSSFIWMKRIDGWGVVRTCNAQRNAFANLLTIIASF